MTSCRYGTIDGELVYGRDFISFFRKPKRKSRYARKNHIAHGKSKYKKVNTYRSKKRGVSRPTKRKSFSFFRRK